MKTINKGMTIIETLIGITLLVIITGSILGLYIVVQQYFKDCVALVKSQATARIVIEKMVRPSIREGSSFSPPPPDGNTVSLTGYNGNTITFTFYNGPDGNDSTFEDNIIKKTENEIETTIGTNIVKIPGRDIFEEVSGSDKLVAINFGVKNEGVAGHYKEVYIFTQIKLRN